VCIRAQESITCAPIPKLYMITAAMTKFGAKINHQQGNHRLRTSPRSGAAIWRVTLRFTPQLRACTTEPIMENMTSSTKPEVDNEITHCNIARRRTSHGHRQHA